MTFITEKVTCTPAVFFDANGAPCERFFCQVCGKNYLRKRHLQRHMRDECIGIPPRFECDFCPSKFRRKYHLVRHLNARHNNANSSTASASNGQNVMAEGKSSTRIDSPDPTSPEDLAVKKENLALAAAEIAAHVANNFSVEAIMMKKENCESLIPPDMTIFDDLTKKFGFQVTPDIFSTLRQMKPLKF